jgi:hypothetical protein
MQINDMFGPSGQGGLPGREGIIRISPALLIASPGPALALEQAGQCNGSQPEPRPAPPEEVAPIDGPYQVKLQTHRVLPFDPLGSEFDFCKASTILVDLARLLGVRGSC